MKTAFLLSVVALSAHSALAAECLGSTPIVHTTSSITGGAADAAGDAAQAGADTVDAVGDSVGVDTSDLTSGGGTTSWGGRRRLIETDVWVPPDATDFSSDCTCAAKATVNDVEVVSFPLKFKCSYPEQKVGPITVAGTTSTYTSEGAVYSCTTDDAYDTAVAAQKLALKTATDAFKALGVGLGEEMAEIASTCVKVSTTGVDGQETSFGPESGSKSAGAVAGVGTVVFAVVGMLVGMLQQ